MGEGNVLVEFTYRFDIRDVALGVFIDVVDITSHI